MEYCKNCLNIDLKPIENYKYFNISIEEKDLVSGYICKNCGCIHGFQDGKLKFWQYEKSLKDNDQFAAAENYVSDQDLALKSIEHV